MPIQVPIKNDSDQQPSTGKQEGRKDKGTESIPG